MSCVAVVVSRAVERGEGGGEGRGSGEWVVVTRGKIA